MCNDKTKNVFFLLFFLDLEVRLLLRWDEMIRLVCERGRFSLAHVFSKRETPPFGQTFANQSLRLQHFVFILSRETRTSLSRIEGMVTHDQSLRMTLAEIGEKPQQRFLLFWSTSVSRLSLGIKTALVAHTYRVSVATSAMSTDKRLITPLLYCSVTPHHIVITYT